MKQFTRVSFILMLVFGLGDERNKLWTLSYEGMLNAEGYFLNYRNNNPHTRKQSNFVTVTTLVSSC